MKTLSGILLGVMLAAVAQAEASEQGTATKRKTKPDVQQIACIEAKYAFIEKFAQLVSTFHDQVELAEATPRMALSQRVADLQKTALELKNAPIPVCAGVSGFSAVVTHREILALGMEGSAMFAIPGDTTGSAAEGMKKAVQELQASDDEIEATCQRLTRDKALNLRILVWKSDAHTAAEFEIKRFLVFMKASGEAGSFEARQAAVEGSLYSFVAQRFRRTTSRGFGSASRNQSGEN